MTVENLNITVKTNADKAAAKLLTLGSALEKVQGSAASVGGGAGAGAAKGVEQVGKAAEKANKPLGNFLSSLKRIAFYRIIRGIIKSITQAFREGLEKAYLFSSSMSGEGNRFAAAMDRMKSAGNQMKGQLGSAFISLLAAVEPVLITLINLVTKVADAISQLFAAFTGKTYLKANATTAKFVDNMKSGGRAAKEWKNQLLGFDEINRLNEPSNGGGGGGANPLAGYEFVDTPLDDWAQRLREIISNLELNFNDVLFKWDNLTAEDILKKLVVGWGALAGGIIGFTIGGVGGAVLGVVVGAGLGLLIDSIVFDNDGVISKGEVAYLLQTALLAVVGGAIGFAIGGPGGALLGAIVGIGVSAVIGKIEFENKEREKYNTGLDWFVVGVLGLPSDEQWKQWGKDVIKWIGEGFEGIGHELWLIFGQPVADVVEDIKKFLGIKSDGAPAQGFEDIGKGIIDGLKDGASSAWDSFKTDIQTKFETAVDDIKNFLGISSDSTPSSVFENLGKNMVQGVWDGVKGKWNDFKTDLEGLWDRLKTWWDGLSLSEFHIPRPRFEWTYTQADGIIAEALKFVGLPATIPHLNISWYAQGGFPETGDLFFANENGAPELVGSMGGRAAVANNDQIVEGIRQGVYDAVVAANNNGSGDVSVRVYLDSREIKAGQQRLNRAWGV